MPVRPVLALLVLSTALLTGCSTGTEDVADSPVVDVPSTAPSAVPSAAPSAAPSVAPSPSPAGARVLDITVAGGKVTGVDGREAVALGEQIVIRVTSDIADEVHVHGYDLSAPVSAGGSVEIPLTADIPGGFEVELEELGKQLFQLRVA